MKDGEIEKLIAAFEAAAQFNDDGSEFWFARDLQRLLDYERRENFASVAGRARTACEGSGQSVEDHFRGVTKMVELGSGATREIDDLSLSRYACYLGAAQTLPNRVWSRGEEFRQGDSERGQLASRELASQIWTVR